MQIKKGDRAENTMIKIRMIKIIIQLNGGILFRLKKA